MPASPSSVLRSVPSQQSLPHLHIAGELCPWCEQPIPHDRFDEIKERIETKEREHLSEITARLQEQFERAHAEAVAKAQADLDQAIAREREEAAARESAARGEERAIAEAEAREKLAAAELAALQAQAALRTQLDEADAAKAEAETATAALQEQLAQVRHDSDNAVAQVKQEAAARELTIREEARQAADEAVQQKLAAMEQARLESEAALHARIEQAEAATAAIDQTRADLASQLEQQRQVSDMTIAELKRQAAEREIIVRQEATAAAEATLQEKVAGAEEAMAAAEAKAAAAEQQLAALAQNHQTELDARLQEQREALERDKTDAVNAEKSAAFEEKLKFSAKIEDLQRALDKKTAEELGEGAEIDLYEVLKAEFEGDRIERVNKGAPGADIIHTVVHNSKECGKIIYDSKNHLAWRNEFVTKLAADQMAAKAEHAILSTRKFPANTRHLHMQDGVILASPARVAALVHVIRRHIVQIHTLRLSNEERAEKRDALYSFITSERCTELFARIDTHTDDLLDLQVKEQKAHAATWKRQGELIRHVQKVRAELCLEIDGIIGTADISEPAP